MGLEIVDYRYGKAAGTLCGKAVCFKGIPYAEPPVGALRWRRTEPLCEKRWEGVRTFDRFGKICPQRHPKIQIPEEEMSEDCLYLNIWTPAESPDDRLPVLVWFHGGSFVFGFSSEPLYSAEQMASKGIVAVTVNYRLGRFEFFTHPKLDAETEEKVSGNYGLWDQVQALKWVKENIAAFGGSPDQVTIAGQSAGGASVSALLGFPESEALFQGGIFESGVHDTDKLNCTLEEAEKDCMGFLASCGKDRLTIEQLRELSWQELMEIDMPIWVDLKPPLRPVIDGVVITAGSWNF